MNPKLLLLIIPLVVFPVAHAAPDVGVSVDIRLGKVLPPPPPEVVVVKESGPKGPPPWAPAHGVRRNRSYYYYPGSNVYFRPDDRTWFHLDGREWRTGLSLPPNVRVDFNRSVSLTMGSEQPYQFHDKVQGYYPADYFVTNVKVKDKDDDRAGDHSPGKGQSQGQGGQGQGKGKGKNR